MQFETDGSSEDVGSTESSFEERLATLREEGCVLLVAGSVDPGLSQRFNRVTMGHPAKLRRRLMVLTDATPFPRTDWFPGDVTADDPLANLLVASDGWRSAASQSATHRQTTRTPDDLRARIERSLTELGARGDRNQHGEIRVGFYSLTPLLYADPVEEVVDFVDALGDLAGKFGAIVHLHYPTDPEDADVETLREHVDGVITLVDAEEPLHRWEFDDLETAPVPIPETWDRDGNRHHSPR